MKERRQSGTRTFGENGMVTACSDEVEGSLQRLVRELEDRKCLLGNRIWQFKNLSI